MNISPLYQVLIYFEDRGEANIEDIKKWGIAVSRGVLGKMEAMGLIEGKKTETTTVYRLSSKGYEYLNKVLDAIHHGTKHWDGKWRMVWFSIPENERPKRDKFRRFLEAQGFKPTLSSLWISPLDLTNNVLSYIKKNALEKYVLAVETSNIYSMQTEDLLKAWDFEQYRSMFENYILHCEEILKTNRQNRFELKKLIFEYALILNSQPKLPIELLPKDWPMFRASLYYKRVRRLIG
jgi:phenylacetic acid degradation operon negative regulatory protein